MGKKYLDTKKNSLEQSILGVWKTAVEEGSGRMDGRTSEYREHRKKLESARSRRESTTKTESYEIGTDEYRKYMERITPGETIEEKSGDKEAYQKFFNSALKKFGVKSPAELKDDKKKEFYDYIDKNWTADHEEAFEFAKESKVASILDTVKNMWRMDEKVKKEDDDKEIKGDKTLTGKKSATVEIDPDIEEKHKKKVHASKAY
tara:strand:- start:355 stop:966 length:612 start_codon:yes stop_codon:yes gene_type:complete